MTDDIGDRVWAEYLRRQIGDPDDSALEPVSPAEVMELLWTFNPMFGAKRELIATEPYSTQFDEEADAALCWLALNDSFDEWESLSAGAWRVLTDRHIFALARAAASRATGDAVMCGLPPGLPGHARSRAVLLQQLLGPARTIPPGALAGRAGGSGPDTPGGSTPH